MQTRRTSAILRSSGYPHHHSPNLLVPSVSHTLSLLIHPKVTFLILVWDPAFWQLCIIAKKLLRYNYRVFETYFPEGLGDPRGKRRGKHQWPMEGRRSCYRFNKSRNRADDSTCANGRGYIFIYQVAFYNLFLAPARALLGNTTNALN